MPDKWEFPWFASWDTAFQSVAIAAIDPDFAKEQLTLLTHEWFMHPNGQIPSHEWDFEDVNPPIFAWAALRVYEIEGKERPSFLEKIFQKFLLTFTWWVNRKDTAGRNIFEGGFLGLDNIGLFNRSVKLPSRRAPSSIGCDQLDGHVLFKYVHHRPRASGHVLPL